MSTSGASFHQQITLENPFDLPVIKFTAGEQMTLAFNIFDEETAIAYDFSSYGAHFSVAGYTNPERPVISTGMSTYGNTLEVTLSPSMTMDLAGKYIYQIAIGTDGVLTDIPGQGILYIARNIDKEYSV